MLLFSGLYHCSSNVMLLYHCSAHYKFIYSFIMRSVNPHKFNQSIKTISERGTLFRHKTIQPLTSVYQATSW
jgi:hypothetical protein